MKEKYSTKYIANMGLLSAFAIVASYLESLIPIDMGIPGIKLGLANIIIVIALYMYNARSAILINLIRIIVVGMLFGNMFSILFSFSGALVSFAVMVLIKKIKNIGILGVSISGGVSHNIAQLVVASFVVNTYNLNYYIPFMLIGGLLTGVLIGLLAMSVISKISKLK